MFRSLNMIWLCHDVFHCVQYDVMYPPCACFCTYHVRRTIMWRSHISYPNGIHHSPKAIKKAHPFEWAFLLLLVEPRGVEPLSENISIRLSPSGVDIFLFALCIAYRRAIHLAISNYTILGRRIPSTVSCFEWCHSLDCRSSKCDKHAD